MKTTPAVMLIALAACGSDPADTPADASTEETCEDILGAPADNRAGFELFDPFPGQGVPIAFAIDDCPAADDGLMRGGIFGQGFLPGERTLTLTFDDEPLAPLELDVAPDDIVWLATDGLAPPTLYRHDGTVAAPDDTVWRVVVMNVSPSDLVVSRAVDPDAATPEYEVAATLAVGETYEAELPVSAERGIPMLLERGGDVLFEGNIGFAIDCDAGEWPGGLTFVSYVDSFPSVQIVYPIDPCP